MTENAPPLSGFETPTPEDAPVQKIQIRDKPNPRWKSHFINKLMTIPRKPIFGPDDHVFTIGSCFAERIRLALGDQGIRVGPPMAEVPTKPDDYRVDSLPHREHMNYYNSFTIRQEFERHIGEWKQAEDDYWSLAKDPWWGGDMIYQDPYRRAIFGRTPELLAEAVNHCNAAIDHGISQSSVFFMTLGMAEVFRNEKSGSIACQKPGYAGGAGEAETEFMMSTYEENLENMSRVVEILTSLKPDVRIVCTVSPVALARTFGKEDILVANTEGKSMLRVVLGALARKYDNVTYFPSYEIVMQNSPFSFREDDGRHVSDWVVGRIVNAFKDAHFDEDYMAAALAAE